MRKWISGIAAGLVFGAILSALAAGIYTNNLPYFGANPAYQAFTTQAPTSLSGGAYTGNEGIPMDTNIPGGSAPQSAAVTIMNMLLGSSATATNTTAFTATVAQVCAGGKQTLLLTGTLAAGATVTTPTAALCLANLPLGVGSAGGTTPVGYNWIVKVVNSSSGAFAWTVAGGTNVTISGIATVAQGTSREFVCAATSATAITCTDNGNGV